MNKILNYPSIDNDIVPMIKFLLSDKSDYINGVNHPITGGESF